MGMTISLIRLDRSTSRLSSLKLLKPKRAPMISMEIGRVAPPKEEMVEVRNRGSSKGSSMKMMPRKAAITMGFLTTSSSSRPSFRSLLWEKNCSVRMP